jgi:hypothetical protein
MRPRIGIDWHRLVTLDECQEIKSGGRDCDDYAVSATKQGARMSSGLICGRRSVDVVESDNPRDPAVCRTVAGRWTWSLSSLPSTHNACVAGGSVGSKIDRAGRIRTGDMAYTLYASTDFPKQRPADFSLARGRRRSAHARRISGDVRPYNARLVKVRFARVISVRRR